MINNERHQASSSGAIVAVLIAGLAVAILGIFVVAGAGLFWVRASAQAERASVAEIRADVNLRHAEAIREELAQQREQSSIVTESQYLVTIDVQLDSEGSVTIDGEGVGIGELKSRIATLQQDITSHFSVHLIPDPECPVKHVIPVLDVLEEMDDIDFKIVSSNQFDESSDESNSEN